MQLSLIPEPFDRRDWLFEIKHDGFRSLAYIFDGECELVSRRRNRYKSFQVLRDEIARTLKVKNAVLDGEIVVLDQQGRSAFNKMLFRRGDPIFYVFDLLWLDNRDLRTKPLIERKKILRKLIALPNATACFLLSTLNDMEPNCGPCALTTLKELWQSERQGVYAIGERWLKIRNRQYSQMEGRHELFDSFHGPKPAVSKTLHRKRRAS